MKENKAPSSDRAVAREALTQLGLKDNPLFRRDPVKLLAQVALKKAEPPVEETAIVKVDKSPIYHELARAVIHAPVGYLVFCGDVKPPRKIKPGPDNSLSLPQTGVLNVQIIEGDWPNDESEYPAQYGAIRVFCEEVLWIGQSKWDLRLPLARKGPQQIELRAYEESGPHPDVVIRLTPKKYITSAVEFVE